MICHFFSVGGFSNLPPPMKKKRNKKQPTWMHKPTELKSSSSKKPVWFDDEKR